MGMPKQTLIAAALVSLNPVSILISGFHGSIDAVAFSPDGRVLALVGNSARTDSFLSMAAPARAQQPGRRHHAHQ